MVDERMNAVRIPWHVVVVEDFSAETIQAILEQLRASSTFEHFVYRESELDAVWSLVDFALRMVSDEEHQVFLKRVHEQLWEAHDCVGDGEKDKAIGHLQALLDILSHQK